MTSNRPSGRPSSGNGVPPTSRRSARQQRLSNREANRALSRASTRGSGGSNRSFLLITVGALAVAAVVIAGALYLTGQKAQVKPFTGPIAPIPSVATPASIPFDGRTLGNANAPHTMDMWEDFQCTACYAFTIDVEPQVVTNYVATGKLKLVYHDLLTIDSKKAGATESLDAANAALCATDQGQFWPYHDWLFTNQYSENSGAFTKDRLKSIAQSAGIKDLTKFNSCVDNGTHNADVVAEQSQTTSTSTPTLIVDGGTPVSFDGSYESVSAVIDAALGINASPSPGASGSASSAPSASPASASPSSASSPSASASAS
jgi:protein-disulfide isomerase